MHCGSFGDIGTPLAQIRWKGKCLVRPLGPKCMMLSQMKAPVRFCEPGPIRKRNQAALQSETLDRARRPLPEIFWWAAILLFGMGTYSRAQTAAEYAGAVSGMSTVGTKASVVETTIPKPAERKSTAVGHLTQSNNASGEDANRKELEGKAGADAGKLLLRSNPTNAVVWIDGKRIGSTPLLLMLAPGAYQVELHGTRMETAERRVDLQPRETRTVILPLMQRYPSHVKLHKVTE